MLTRTVAATLGLPLARAVVVAHPIGGVDDATILARADAAVEDLLRQLSP